ncbi:MAG: DEAD/DEAH box helicase, partial [Actinomycetes bacterium]
MARRPRAAPGRLAGSPSDPLAGFSVATRTWFTAAFVEPTPVQVGTWDAVRSGRDVLAVAPTGSGKTLAAFLWSLDRIVTEPRPVDSRRRLRVLYISPMKALAADVECNLRAPLAGIQQASARLGLPEPDVQVALRTGDTPPGQRRRLATRPPDVLITTPESLFLLLTARVREVLRGVDTVIVDEVHAVAGSKRGAHLAVSLERLDALLEVPARRIGLSATVRPVEDVARFLGGMRDVTVVAPPANKRLELEVVVPVADLGSLAATKGASGPGGAGGTGAPAGADVARASIWPHVEERIVDLVQLHRSTIVFANSRRLA